VVYAFLYGLKEDEYPWAVRQSFPKAFCRVCCVQYSDNTDAPFSGVCEYQLLCKKSADEVQPYPPCAHTSWGPGDSVGQYSLTPLHGDSAIVETAGDGAVELRFQTSRDLRFTARLKSVAHADEELSAFVLHRVVGHVAIFLVKVNSPRITG